MNNFKLEIENAFKFNETELNGKSIINYIEVAGHTVAIMGFFFNGLNEARIDFATFDAEGIELHSGKQGNTFSVRDVLSIMKACETMAKTLEERFYPERIAFTGSEAKRFSLYQRVAKKLCAGRKVWTEPSSLTVWVELQDEWC